MADTRFPTTLDELGPPPEKTDAHGFISAAFSTWEMARSEIVQSRGRPRPSDATLDILSRWDALIERAQGLVQDTARMKHALQARIDEAAGSADQRFLAGGIVSYGAKPHLGKLAELRRSHDQAAAAMQEAKDEEVRLRVARGEISAGAQVAGGRVRVPGDGNRAYSYSSDRVVEGKVISG